MPYISRDGTVHNRAPWSVEYFWGMICGFFALILMFLRTLVDPLLNIQGNGSGSNWRGGGGGGGGGSGNRRGPPPGGLPRRPIGRINTLADCTIPGGG